MSSLSKFPPEMATMSCKVLGHPGTQSCLRGALNNFLISLAGSGGFYSFLYLCQLVSKYLKGKKKPSAKSFFKAVARSTLSTSLIIFNSSISYCVLRKILGRFYYYTTAFLPSFIGSFSLLLETENIKEFFACSLFNGVLEYLLVDLGMQSLSKTQQTLIFMTVSSILSYLFCVTDYKQQYFWFFVPSKNKSTEKESVQQKCCHNGHCLVYILKLFIIYFSTGYALQSLRFFSSNIMKSKGSVIFSLLKVHNFRLAAFLGTYALIYQSVRCLFLRKTGKYLEVHDFIAGLLAGTTFRFQPNVPILNSGLICIIQILARMGRDYDLLPRLPYKEMVSILCIAFIFHVKIFFDEKCPDFIRHLVSSVSNRRVDKVHEAYLKIFIDKSTKSFVF